MYINSEWLESASYEELVDKKAEYEHLKIEAKKQYNNNPDVYTRAVFDIVAESLLNLYCEINKRNQEGVEVKGKKYCVGSFFWCVNSRTEEQFFARFSRKEEVNKIFFKCKLKYVGTDVDKGLVIYMAEDGSYYSTY